MADHDYQTFLLCHRPRLVVTQACTITGDHKIASPVVCINKVIIRAISHLKFNTPQAWEGLLLLMLSKRRRY